IQILYGLSSIKYEDMLKFLHRGGDRPIELDGRMLAEMQAAYIQGIQSLLVEKLTGEWGLCLCLAATSFFMPRMLEKGAADILFSNAVSRARLMLSRYFAGLLFVGLLAALLVVGLYLAFLVTSGYNDTGFLWGALTLVYLFALLHAFSICVGVLTRSSVAAIL